jgi:hypothetical protein
VLLLTADAAVAAALNAALVAQSSHSSASYHSHLYAMGNVLGGSAPREQVDRMLRWDRTR